MSTPRGRRLLVALAAALGLGIMPAGAATHEVLGVRFEEATQTLFLETTGTPRVTVKRLHNPDRLVLDVVDASLRPVAVTVTSPGRKIRGYRTGPLGSPEGTRIVLELQPGVEPLVSTRQQAGKVAVTLGDAPLPRGERDLETLPPADLLAGFALPEPIPTPTVAPTPRPLPVVEVPAPVEEVATPSPTPAVVAEPPWPVTVTPRVVRDEGRQRPDFGSTIMLRWQQVEALEDYGLGSGPIFAYPAGISGVEWRHWWGSFVGVGADTRILSYDVAVAGTRQNRTDVAIRPVVAMRLPLMGGGLEPELNVGYMARHVTVLSTDMGSGPAFAPTQFHYGPTLGGALRARLLPGFSLQLAGQYLPVIGGNLYGNFGSQSFGNIFFLSELAYRADLVLDVGPAYLSLGYGDDSSQNASRAYRSSFSGLRAGLGWRY